MLFFMCYMPVFNLDRPISYFIWPVTKKQTKAKPGWFGHVYTRLIPLPRFGIEMEIY